jgi:hypothetical protein
MTAPNSEDNPEITPQVIHLVDLLKWAREGRLRVPKFQRDFVWRRQDIVDLFDSIANQYPIGTLFLWNADPLPANRGNIGPLSLPDYSGQNWLVLDGQQRLTTLVGVLLKGERSWSAALDQDDPKRWDLFFDTRPDEGGFVHLASDEEPGTSYIPVPALLDTIRLFKEVQRMAASGSTDHVETWITRAQEVARAIQGYRVPIVQFTTNNLSVAVESFSRLNKKGRSIGQDEMFSALTYEEQDGKHFHLAAEIDRLQKAMIRSGFGEVDRTILLRAVLTAAELDLYRTDWTRLSQQVKSATREKLPAAVDEAERGLERARSFLNDLGILNARMLPYSMQLVALSAFFGRCAEPTDSQRKLLERWFWSSSFAGWFGSGNPSRVRRLVQELQKLPEKDQPSPLENMDLEQEALPTPLRFDLRSARVRTLVCLLLRRPPMRPDGVELSAQDAATLLFERGPAAMSKVCATVESVELRTSPANRILDVAPDVPGQAKNWLVQLDPSVRDEVLRSHAIPPETFSLLMNGEHDAFLKSRLEYLGKLERRFMKEVGVTPPDSEEPARSPIDADDESPLNFLEEP